MRARQKVEPEILRENGRSRDKFARRRRNQRQIQPPATPGAAPGPGLRAGVRGTYFFAGAAAAAEPEPLKYLKKSEFESITITSL